MRNFKIYLAGGMGNLTFKEANDWRVNFENVIRSTLDKVGVSIDLIIINPNDYFNFVDNPKKYKSEREVKRFDLYHVRTSDMVVVNFNDPKSIGTTWELAVATERNIPVLGLKKNETVELHPWLRDDCDCCERTFTNMDELIKYIIEFYFI